MRIALATCSNLPGWEVDDLPLFTSLIERGIDLQRPAWSDPDFDWSSCAGCLIRTTWDYPERLQEFLAWIDRADQETLLLNPASVVRWNIDKTYLRDLEARGASVIPTIWIERGAAVDVRAMIESHRQLFRSGRAFLKPSIGATSRDTLRFALDKEGIAAARQHIDRLRKKQTILLQPYYGSVETFGEVSAIYIDGKFSHGVRKVPVSGDYRVQDDFGAHDEPYTFFADERCRIDSVVDIAGARNLLYARIDLLRGPDGDLQLTELELIEPSLFFRHSPSAAQRLADALIKRLKS